MLKLYLVVYANTMQTSRVPQTGFEPVHNQRSGLIEWICAVVITTGPGIGHFVKSALSEKKFFSNINETYQKQLPIWGDSTFTCPSGLCKCLFVT